MLGHSIHLLPTQKIAGHCPITKHPPVEHQGYVNATPWIARPGPSQRLRRCSRYLAPRLRLRPMMSRQGQAPYLMPQRHGPGGWWHSQALPWPAGVRCMPQLMPPAGEEYPAATARRGGCASVNTVLDAQQRLPARAVSTHCAESSPPVCQLLTLSSNSRQSRTAGRPWVRVPVLSKQTTPR